MSQSAGLGFLLDVEGFELMGGVVKPLSRRVVNQCGSEYLVWIGERDGGEFGERYQEKKRCAG